MTDGKTGVFSERLKEAMRLKSATARQTAAGAKITEAAVSRYLSGERQNAGFSALCALAKFLGVSSDYLLGLTNNPFCKENLPEEVKELLTLYLRLSPADKSIVWAVLKKEQTEN